MPVRFRKLYIENTLLLQAAIYTMLSYLPGTSLAPNYLHGLPPITVAIASQTPYL